MTADVHSSTQSAPLNLDVTPNRPLRIAINGFGRIGRNVLRAMIERFDVLGNWVHIVAINDLADAQSLLHLLQYDSTHGRLSQQHVQAALVNTPSKAVANFDSSNNDAHNTDDVESTPKTRIALQLTKNDKTYRIPILNEPNPLKLPWRSLKVDLVLECTGFFRSYEQAYQHIKAGAKQVIIGAAPFDNVDACVVMGVNQQLLTKDLPIISSVSCTTQALVPLIFTLDNAFDIASVMMTEIHAVTADQNVLDQAHRDLRRARASGHNIIPTTSSSIAATQQVLPNMQGKINGHSIRVPTIDVAAIDVTVVFNSIVTIAQIRDQLLQASQNQLKGIMGYTVAPLVSSDFIHQPESLIVDGLQIMQVGSQFKVFAWYDNEWGYANRLLDMCLYIAQL